MGRPGLELVSQNECEWVPVTRNDFRRRRKSDVKKDHLSGMAVDGAGPDAGAGMGGNAR